ncbi:MAG: amidohydrolase family protein [Verrucomicrobiota bacterium]|nr:amidohydrolase family protein [Verrucomicrobiota bacterium]
MVRAEPPVDPQIARVIAATKAIDNHAHPMRATAEGEEDTDWDQIPSDVEAFTPPVRLRPDNPERIAAWRALFGYKYNDMSEPHVAELAAKRHQLRAAKGDAYPSWVLDQIGTETMLANRAEMGRGLTPPRFRWVSFVDALAFPLDNSRAAAFSPDRKIYFGDVAHLQQRYLAARKIEQLPASLVDYLRLVVMPTLEEQKARGAVAIKFEAAYLRSLEFGNPSSEEAAAIYARYAPGGAPTPDEYKTLQDYIYRFLASEAGRLQLAVHIHVGGGVGGWFDQEHANPVLLSSLFNDPELSQTKFVMLHAAWPYGEVVAGLLSKPNVYADFSAMTFLLYPPKLAACLRTWLEFQPGKVLFGTDAFPLGPAGWEDLAWITAETARQSLGLALTGMLHDGTVTPAGAEELARNVLRGNAAKLYGF